MSGFTAINAARWAGAPARQHEARQSVIPRQRRAADPAAASSAPSGPAGSSGRAGSDGADGIAGREPWGRPGDDPWLRLADWIRAADSEVLALIPADCSLFAARPVPWRAGAQPRARVLTILAGLPAGEVPEQLAGLVGDRPEVRFGRHSPTLLLVLDRRVAVLAGGRPAGATTLTVLRAEPAIDALATVFSHHWRNAADDRAPTARRLRLTTVQARVLHRLATGVTDEVVARELDISTRTVQRHVTQIMGMVGVRSRLELGLRLAELGLMAVPPSSAAPVPPTECVAEARAVPRSPILAQVADHHLINGTALLHAVRVGCPAPAADSGAGRPATAQRPLATA